MELNVGTSWNHENHSIDSQLQILHPCEELCIHTQFWQTRSIRRASHFIFARFFQFGSRDRLKPLPELEQAETTWVSLILYGLHDGKDLGKFW